MHFDYHIPTKIIFGRGRLKELATEELPGSKALIVITNGQSMKRLGYLNQVTQYLKENGVDSVLFDKVLPNPTLAHVSEAAELARRENCDMVVGLGGGSAASVRRLYGNFQGEGEQSAPRRVRACDGFLAFVGVRIADGGGDIAVARLCIRGLALGIVGAVHSRGALHIVCRVALA